MRTHNIPSCYRKSKRSLLCLLTWRYYQSSLAQLPLSRTNLHGPKGVRAIEVRLYTEHKRADISKGKPFQPAISCLISSCKLLFTRMVHFLRKQIYYFKFNLPSSCVSTLNPISLRKAKTLWSFGLSECKRVL